MATEWEERWAEIEKAGSINAYIQQQLVAKGFLVERRATDKMTPRELEQYKKSLKTEATEKAQLRKAAWQVYKANHMVYLGEGIYWSDDSSEDDFDLASAEKRLLDNQLPAITKVKQLAEQLKLTIPQLRQLCYHREAATDLNYTRFEIPKRSGGMRPIWAPRLLLKNTQRWILEHILERLLVHGAAHGFLMGRSIATNAAQHNNSEILIKLDIKDFFPSISWRRVKGVFRKAGYREQVATLLALLCTEAPREVVERQGKKHYVALGARCLPQGAPTSPALTNVLCLRLDRRLTGIATKFGWRYSRYADDMTFSLPVGHAGDPQIAKVLGSIQRVMGEEGFELNRAKTHIVRRGARQEVTGLVVNNEGLPRVKRSTKRQMRAALHNLKTGKGLKEGESLNRLKGYAAYMAMTERELGLRLLSELSEFG
ncbi:retron St85 family RNA-directed DNA polymerase [Thiofilum flexile]|uniref:retron St85 family RNA-directed DNA polymerase n=1 Tax=Thiofilum flexile TaxID=125627 RepID=UPI000369122B|nr:retron St85 family RNA-directed DNA polymerase [Thiofilum flexile]